MLIHCDQCHSKYKITIKKIPSKPVNFRCGKCQKNIVISPEELQKDLGTSAEAAPPESASLGAQATSPAQSAQPATPEAESKSLGAQAPSADSSLGARVTSPASTAPEPTEASSTDTVQLTCLKCGAAFVKHKDDKARLCYQCRIDAIVSKIKDKYGVTQEGELPEAKSKYTFRSPDGLILGPIRLKTVVVLVREKRLLGREDVSKDGAEFQPLAELEELKKLFPDLAPPAPDVAPEPAPEHEEEISLDLEEFPLEPVPPALGAQVTPPAQEPTSEARVLPPDSSLGARVPSPAPAEPSPKPAPIKPAKPAPASPPDPMIELELQPLPDAPAEPEPVLELELEPLPEAPAKPAPTLGAQAPSPTPETVSRYKIRYPDGLVLGPIRLLAVEDLIAAGNLTGQEEVQKDNAAWKPFLDFPELKRLMASGEEIAEDEVVELTDLLEEVS